jgi:type IV pilus assembly protein PilV
MSKNTGFTLIEVLVAVIILAVGILGMASLQMNGIKNIHSAYYRSQATQLGYDIADRIRSNFVEANKLANSAYVTNAVTAATAQADCTSVTTTCTTVDMAINDLYEWHEALKALNLGELNSSITVVAATKVFTIRIRWDDNRSGIVDGGDPDFQMSFHI